MKPKITQDSNGPTVEYLGKHYCFKTLRTACTFTRLIQSRPYGLVFLSMTWAEEDTV